MSPLIDTNILSELMRRRPDPNVVAWAGRQPGFAVSVITIEELVFGLTRRNLPLKRQWLDDFLGGQCEILQVTPAIALSGGTLRGRFAASGVGRHPSDMLIAATAPGDPGGEPQPDRSVVDRRLQRLVVQCILFMVQPAPPAQRPSVSRRQVPDTIDKCRDVTPVSSQFLHTQGGAPAPGAGVRFSARPTQKTQFQVQLSVPAGTFCIAGVVKGSMRLPAECEIGGCNPPLPVAARLAGSFRAI